MIDTLSPEQRSERMSRVRGKDTVPELIVRKLLHSAGFRYRLHRRDLPGNPDIVFMSRKKAIFVHGCFWHMHDTCALARMPKSRISFWSEKLLSNKQRDVKNMQRLHDLGWNTLVIWECELRDLKPLLEKLQNFIDGPPHN